MPHVEVRVHKSVPPAVRRAPPTPTIATRGSFQKLSPHLYRQSYKLNFDTNPIAQYPQCRKPGQTERPRARVRPPISLQPRPADKQQTRQEPTNPTSAVNLASLSVPQLRALQTRLTSELEHLTTSHTKLRAAQAKFRDCVRSITDGVTGNEKKGTDGRNEILVPLTSSLYVKGRLTDREKVLVDVGTGFYVEKVCVVHGF